MQFKIHKDMIMRANSIENIFSLTNILYGLLQTTNAGQAQCQRLQAHIELLNEPLERLNRDSDKNQVFYHRLQKLNGVLQQTTIFVGTFFTTRVVTRVQRGIAISR